MNLNEFLIRTIENIAVTLPALAVLLSPIVYGLKKIKDVTSAFPKSVDDTKEKLVEDFAKTEFNLKGMLEETTEKLQEKVNSSLVGMQDQLSMYKQTLQSQVDQNNLLVKQNKLFTDTISELIGQDPQMIQNGVASKISTKLNLTQEQLLQYPELLVRDSELLQKALVETKALLGDEKYQEILAKANAKEV